MDEHKDELEWSHAIMKFCFIFLPQLNCSISSQWEDFDVTSKKNMYIKQVISSIWCVQSHKQIFGGKNYNQTT